MAYGGPNDDVNDDVTWPLKVNVMTQIIFERIISNTA